MPWDSPLAELADLVAACADLSADPTGDLSVTEVVVELPVELGVRADADGLVELVAAPPRQAMETTVMPVLHRIRLRVEVT